ncbi:MAG: hypothetical protein AAF193_09110, partial [Bacteroidota bacterium]
HNAGFGKGKYDIHVTNDNNHSNTSNLRDRRTKLSARKQRKQYSMNSLSNLMTMPHPKTHERGIRHSHKTSKGGVPHGRTVMLNMTTEESSKKVISGKHSDVYHQRDHQHHSKRKMKHQRNLSTKNLQNLRSSQTGHTGKVKGLSTYEEEFLQLSPSLQKNSKISSSYNGCYNMKHERHHHSKLDGGSSKLSALKEADEFGDFSSSTYNKIKNELRQSKNIAKMQRKQKRLSQQRTKKSTDIDIHIDISGGKAMKTYGHHTNGGLTLDIENLENHKLTNTHYQHSHLPPQSPLNQFQYPSTTKNSKNETSNHRRVRRVPTDEGNPLSLISMNNNPKTKKLAKKIQYAQAQKQEHRRSMKESYDRNGGHYEASTSSKYKKRQNREMDYFNYEQVTQSYVDGKDGTRNYQIKEITDFEDNSDSSRKVRKMKSSTYNNNQASSKHRKHKISGSFG